MKAQRCCGPSTLAWRAPIAWAIIELVDGLATDDAALSARPFGQRALEEVTHPGLVTVISATDMTSGNAERFGSRSNYCSAYGEITDPVMVAEAVAASAAFPVLLPALCRDYHFRDRTTGTERTTTVMMTDGGVYDNLGLSPLLPGRSAEHTAHVDDLDYLIVADAGRGRGRDVSSGTLLAVANETGLRHHLPIADYLLLMVARTRSSFAVPVSRCASASP
jgi:predicted acylesterase/phospholipase RssA